MSTTISVSHEELSDGFREGISGGKPYAVKKYLLGWDDRYQFVRDMQGYSSATGSGNPWIQTVPYQYPDSPNLYADSLEIEPAGKIIEGRTPLAFEYAIITVTFTVSDWPYQQSDDPLNLQSVTDDPAENQQLQYCRQKIQYGYETYPIPNSSVAFADGTKYPTQGVYKLPVTTVTLMWKDYPYQPFKYVRDLLGCVNQGKFLGCGDSTVFFDSFDTDPKFLSDGTKVCDVTEVFKYRTIDWNQFVRPDKFQWATLKDNTGATIYTKKDFSKLLLG
ncbi:hypothetical protein [Singulisphaera sp. PoT]|uniref:hypothetical protein n=1 Tax=Singulisphaera sp. PoT TaxID=3411797 RepID=UPI003BF60277